MHPATPDDAAARHHKTTTPDAVGQRGRVRPDPPEQEPLLTWSTWREACRVLVYRRHLRATIRIALIVGTVRFTINQLDVVLAGDATAKTWIKSGVTYLVPFVVSNLGVLTGTRRRG